MTKKVFLFCIGLWPVSSLSAAPLTRAGAGGALTLGTHGFHGVSLYGDMDWAGKRFFPYAWADFTDNSFVNQFSFGGGAWRRFKPAAVKAGLGLAFGEDEASGDSLESFTLETGLQRAFRHFRAGADYRLTHGTLSGARYSGSANENLSSHGKKPAAVQTVETEVDSFTTHEVSAFAGRPAGDGWLQGRVTFVQFPGEDVVSESLGWSYPLSPGLLLTPTLTLEQGPVDRVYVSASAYWNFDLTKSRRRR